MGVGVRGGAGDQTKIHRLPCSVGETRGEKCLGDKLWVLPHAGCDREEYTGGFVFPGED